VVQPVTADVIARYGGLRAEQLQARMLASGATSDAADIEAFCAQARVLFAGTNA
jgi:ATP adenylyltransferase